MRHTITAVVTIAFALILVGCGSNDTVDNFNTSNLDVSDYSMDTETTNDYTDSYNTYTEPVELETDDMNISGSNDFEDSYTGWLPSSEIEFRIMSNSLTFAEAFSTARLMLGGDSYFVWNDDLYSTNWVTETDLWLAKTQEEDTEDTSEIIPETEPVVEDSEEDQTVVPVEDQTEDVVTVPND